MRVLVDYNLRENPNKNSDLYQHYFLSVSTGFLIWRNGTKTNSKDDRNEYREAGEGGWNERIDEETTRASIVRPARFFEETKLY